jgi:hypothetical protein
MALIFCDGFDHYDTDRIARKWDYSGGSFGGPWIDVGTGRFGSDCLKMTDTWHTVMKAFPLGPLQYVTAGVAFKPGNGLVTTQSAIISFISGTTVLCGVAATATHNLFAFSGNDEYWNFTVLGYANRPIRTRSYNYIEIQVDGFSGGAGNIKVWLNEVLVINLAGVCTTHGGYAVAEAVKLGGRSSWIRTDFPSGIYFDDFYVTNNVGSYNLGNLGDVRVIEQLPIADVDKEWTRSAGADNYALVDDPADDIDDDTTYVTTPTLNAKDTYEFPDLPTSVGDVKAMVMNFYAKKVDSGSRGVAMVAKQGGNYGVGDEKRVGGDYVVYQSYMERDVNDAQWTIANVNATASGPKLTT